MPFSRNAKGMEIGELLEVVHPSLLAAMVYVTDSHLSCLHRMSPQGWRRLELSCALVTASWVDHYVVNYSSWCRADVRAALFLASLKYFFQDQRTRGVDSSHILSSHVLCWTQRSCPSSQRGFLHLCQRAATLCHTEHLWPLLKPSQARL